jgi:molybdenum cofactor cytidylyltransferase
VTFALIPAAGKSVRMGQPKLLLPLRGRPVLEHTIAAFHDVGVERVLVVIGPHLPELACVAEKIGAQVLMLDTETADMRATLERGLDHLEGTYHPDVEDDWFLLPADHPALEPGVIRELLQARSAYPEHSIFVPTFEGRRGHPVLIGWRHVAGIRAWPRGLGLDTYLRACADAMLEHPVTSRGILLDMDTPADYERMNANIPANS